MAAFLLSSVISWLVVTGLIVINRRHFSLRPGKHIYAYKLGNKLKFLANQGVIHFLLNVLIVILAIPLCLVILQQIYTPDWLYGFIDLLTSDRFGRVLLGIIFGSLLSTWMVQLYRQNEVSGRRRKTAPGLSLPQKFEGIALLAIFVLGTTSLTFDDIVRSFAYGQHGVEFKLATTSGVGAASPATRSEQILAPVSSANQRTAETTRSKWGLEVLSSLGSLVERDEANISPTANDFSKAAILAGNRYASNIQPLVACLADLADATGDEVYLRDLIEDIKLEVYELHVTASALPDSLRSRSEADQAADLAKIKTSFNLNLTRLYKRIIEHTKRLAPNLRIMEGAGVPVALAKCQSIPEPVDYGEAIASEGFASRPYTSMVYAAMLQIEKNELAAIDALLDWQYANERRFEADLNKQGAPVDALQRRKEWYDIRIYSSVFTVFESLFRREPNQPQILIDRFLKITETYMDLMQARLERDDVYGDMFENPKTNLRDDNFANSSWPLTECKVSGDLNSIRLGYQLLLAKSVYTRRAIDHPEFADRYLPSARARMNEVVDANPACFQVIFLREANRAVMQAENLYLYARLMIAQAVARRPINNAYDEVTRDDLTTASNALALAVNITDDTSMEYRSDHLSAASRSQPVRYARHVGGSELDDVRTRALTLQRATKRALENFN